MYKAYDGKADNLVVNGFGKDENIDLLNVLERQREEELEIA
jgi:hypothetical protein